MLHSEKTRNDQNYSTGLDNGATRFSTTDNRQKPPTRLYESDLKRTVQNNESGRPL